MSKPLFVLLPILFFVYLIVHRKSNKSRPICREWGEFPAHSMNVPKAYTNLLNTMLSSPSILNEFLRLKIRNKKRAREIGEVFIPFVVKFCHERVNKQGSQGIERNVLGVLQPWLRCPLPYNFSNNVQVTWRL